MRQAVRTVGKVAHCANECWAHLKRTLFTRAIKSHFYEQFAKYDDDDDDGDDRQAAAACLYSMIIM